MEILSLVISLGCKILLSILEEKSKEILKPSFFSPMTYICEILLQCSIDLHFESSSHLHIASIEMKANYVGFRNDALHKLCLKLECIIESNVWKSIANVQNFYLKINRIEKQYNFYLLLPELFAAKNPVKYSFWLLTKIGNEI